MMSIKRWRNQQRDVLRQNVPLTNKDQEIYYTRKIKPSITTQKPKCILFSFMELNSCIGYGGLTNIDWVSKRAELSFLVDTQRTKDPKTYQKDLLTFLNLICRVSFPELKLNRLFTETFDIRPLHISGLEEFGFKLEGRLKEHVFVSGKFADSLIHGLLRKEYVRK